MLRARFRAVSGDLAVQAGQQAALHLSVAPEYQSCRRLVLYAELPDELPLAGVVSRARVDGKRLLFPRSLPGSQLAWSSVDRIEDLRPGRYGVREPSAEALVQALGPDVLMLVPGLAFDRQGGRLGRGGGAWDRALAERRGARVFGVCFESQVIERVPREEHDQTMDALLTEVGIRRFSRP
jgi:5-formyltetrahydrofolate cyclo-ligase